VKEPSKEQIKERAKFLREVLREKHKIDLPHGHALEVLAKVFGYKDWNTASALSADVSHEQPVTNKLVTKVSNEKPIATKLPTAGEIVDFFSKFERGTRVFVNEYKWAEPDSNDHSFGTVTSICSLTYDYEIQRETELILELNTESERNDTGIGGSRSATQTFEKTPAGRAQRRIKYLYMQNDFWNPGLPSVSSNRKS
jgi:hypothetical protein